MLHEIKRSATTIFRATHAQGKDVNLALDALRGTISLSAINEANEVPRRRCAES